MRAKCQTFGRKMSHNSSLNFMLFASVVFLKIGCNLGVPRMVASREREPNQILSFILSMSTGGWRDRDGGAGGCYAQTKDYY